MSKDAKTLCLTSPRSMVYISYQSHMFLQYVMTRMVLNAQQNYLIEGLAGNLVDKGVAIL